MSYYFNELISNHPIRRKQRDKDLFIDYIEKEAKNLNYEVIVDKKAEHKNIIIGNVKTAEVIFTAHYDTPPKSIIPNLMLPRNPKIAKMYSIGFFTVLALLALLVSYVICNIFELKREVFAIIYLVLYFASTYLLFRLFDNKNNYNDNTSGVATVLELMKITSNDINKKTAFILFDNEENGMKGSKYLVKENPNINNKIIINLDCVGNGNNFIFICKDKAFDSVVLNKFKNYLLNLGEDKNYKYLFYGMNGSFSNSDYKSFDKGIGVMACIKGKGKIIKYFTPRIHTKKDTVVTDDNIVKLANDLKRGIIDEL